MDKNNTPEEVNEEDFNEIFYMSPPLVPKWIPREISMQTSGVDDPMRGGHK
ncbi:hypothetical protein LCGC14_1422560 [marine sediment metagenome]|uniref:Uncharacterized protein n=1 Tax=marine sediment metagenome TaxID=412755 RepID=A0A0F9KC26_9ZZZZ